MLHITVDTEIVDVNVHPTKMEVRFQNQQDVYNAVCEALSRALHHEELIPRWMCRILRLPLPRQSGRQERIRSGGTQRRISESRVRSTKKRAPLSPKFLREKKSRAHSRNPSGIWTIL